MRAIKEQILQIGMLITDVNAFWCIYFYHCMYAELELN